MFVGIDPDGLIGLARALDEACLRIHHTCAVVQQMIARHGANPQAVELAGIAMQWGQATAADLRWRAEAVRSGQESRFHPAAILRAEFAATGLFAPGDQESGFSTWLQDRDDHMERVGSAVDRIAALLYQGWLDWDVTNTDLHRIQAELESLAGPALDQAIAALTPPQLQRWIAEMGHSFNGFSRVEKQQVFEFLATNGSGETLLRIHDAALVAGTEHDLVDLGLAIKNHSPDGVITRFVAATAAADLGSSRFSTLAAGLALEGIDDAALATETAATILGTRDALPLFVVDTLAAGTRPDALLHSLLVAGAPASRAFVDLLTLLATPGSVGALVAARHPGPDGNGGEPPHELAVQTDRELLAAATELLSHNPDGVFTHLATTADRNGDMTTRFWHRLAENGDAEAIAGIVTALTGGDEVDPARFSDAGSDPVYPYPHARNLAFAAATLNRGLTTSAHEAHNDIDAIGRVAGIAASVSGLFTGGAALAEGVVGTGSGWGIDAFAADAKADIDAELAALIDTATARLRPADGVDLTRFPGSANAMLAWTSVYTRLLPGA